MRRQTSPRGIALIKFFENFSPTVYTCPAGFPTIGWGHKVLQRDTFVPPITVDQADLILHNDLGHVEIYLTGVLPGLTRNEFDALVSLIENIGVGAFDQSTLLKLIKAGNKVAAAQEFGRWVHDANRNVLPGLVTRRQAERDMFMENSQ